MSELARISVLSTRSVMPLRACFLYVTCLTATSDGGSYICCGAEPLSTDKSA